MTTFYTCHLSEEHMLGAFSTLTNQTRVSLAIYGWERVCPQQRTIGFPPRFLLSTPQSIVYFGFVVFNLFYFNTESLKKQQIVHVPFEIPLKACLSKWFDSSMNVDCSRKEREWLTNTDQCFIAFHTFLALFFASSSNCLLDLFVDSVMIADGCRWRFQHPSQHCSRVQIHQISSND